MSALRTKTKGPIYTKAHFSKFSHVREENLYKEGKNHMDL